VRRTGYSRGLIRRILRGQCSDIFRVRERSLELHLPWLDERWSAGDRNAAALWRRLKQRGFRGCLRVMTFPRESGHGYGLRGRGELFHLVG
jgi:hypothetical protein